jgi:SOS-response transcriptional repressor LexA
MEPIVHHGDTILIRRTHEARNNQVAVVRIRDEIYIKYYQRDALGRWIRLTSENDIYKAMDFSGKEIEEVVVIGVLIGKFKPF